ncbi:MAG: undecaprenyl/decaprenyl-phosphate alpha-N-acetylglucosaminyl 1-phosphate transferase [Candidatus Omnitrophica bacterium]|nr:undecaprenyl/decaprenyl-phosphate alpha-N-acetylglucosaminyl 1-phosphate transferase [Candidatus Omnitrophota bacterium]
MIRYSTVHQGISLGNAPQLALGFLISFLAVYLSTPIFRKLAVRLKILDLPNKRKIHRKVTPLLGGLAIYLGILLGMCVDLKSLQFFLPAILGTTFIVILGVIDDKRGLSAQVRFFCQVLISLILIFSGTRITFLPESLWGNIGEVILTILWLVGVTNAYNYLDGMDGLACGSAVINLLCFLIILYKTVQRELLILPVTLMASCLGFLRYNNFKRAKIFLGDAGSTLLGFLLAYISLAGNWAQDNVVKISIPILILGVPIFDMIFTTIMRIREEKIKTLIQWLQYGGRDHFHHYLVDLGLLPKGAVVFIYFVSLSLGLSAIVLSDDSAWEAFLTLLQASIIFGIIATLIVVGKRRRSGWGKV